MHTFGAATTNLATLKVFEWMLQFRRGGMIPDAASSDDDSARTCVRVEKGARNSSVKCSAMRKQSCRTYACKLVQIVNTLASGMI
mmetsp:Transcript_19545/g.42193  ORF Transcript_19545/g.42193 Transcript_19545/m.42193 type:complete len:85 (+) Transcript_19545:2986-3240(+)